MFGGISSRSTELAELFMLSCEAASCEMQIGVGSEKGWYLLNDESALSLVGLTGSSFRQDSLNSLATAWNKSVLVL